MSATDEVVDHIRGSLLDLRRRLEPEIVAEVARAVMRGAAEALKEMDADEAPLAAADPLAPRALSLRLFQGH